MSPEQLRGQPLDQRSDLFSLGIVLYELLSGRHPFAKGPNIETASAILTEHPPRIGELSEGVPAPLERVVEKLLAKEVGDRYGSAENVAAELGAVDWEAQDPASVAVLAEQIHPTQPAKWQSLLPWAMSGLLSVVALLAFWRPWENSPESEPPRRLEVSIGADASLEIEINLEGNAAFLSPDGSLLAFVAIPDEGGQRQLYVRRLDQLQATPLSGTEGVRGPFFSPDGRWIGFFADGKLKKIPVTGGAAITLCDAPSDRGGAWGDDGSIVFSATRYAGLASVSSAGGIPQQLTAFDETEQEYTHRWPQLLPGSKAVLFTSPRPYICFEEANLIVQTIPAGHRKILVRGGYHGRYLPSGHLLYIREGTLFAAPFDVQKLELTGEAVPIQDGVHASPRGGSAQFAYSQEGTLVYLPHVNTNPQVTLHWLGRSGETKPLLDVPGDYRSIRLAPGGQRLAVEINDGAQSDIWAYEWERDMLTPLTFDAATDTDPLWSPSGDGFVFMSEREGVFDLYWKQADGGGEVQRLTESREWKIPFSWHPEGKFLAFFELFYESALDIRILALEGDDRSGWKPGQVATFLDSPFEELSPAFSPDGRWLAYQSVQSGQSEIYVRPFPGPGRKWQISNGGGKTPIWSDNGRELFYVAPTRQIANKPDNDGRIMVATYSAEGESFEASRPRLWSEVSIWTSDRKSYSDYDLHPDGERFAVKIAAEEQVEEKRDKVVLIENFFELLRQEVGSQ